MSAIDRIYGTLEQYEEFTAWCAFNNKKLLPFLREWTIEQMEDGLTHAISEFPEWADKWLFEHCDIRWVIERIKDQYDDEKPWGFTSGLDLKERPCEV